MEFLDTYSQTFGLLGSICIFILTSNQLTRPLKEAQQKGIWTAIMNHYFLFVGGSAFLAISYIFQLIKIGRFTTDPSNFWAALALAVASYIGLCIVIAIIITARYKIRKRITLNYIKTSLSINNKTNTMTNNDLLGIQSEIISLKVEISALNSKIAPIEHNMATKNQLNDNIRFTQSLLHNTEDLNAKLDTTASNDAIARLNAKLDNISSGLFNIEADLKLMKS